VTTLIEELYVEAEFNAHLGDPEILPSRRYPQAIALALALRHMAARRSRLHPAPATHPYQTDPLKECVWLFPER